MRRELGAPQLQITSEPWTQWTGCTIKSLTETLLPAKVLKFIIPPANKSVAWDDLPLLDLSDGPSGVLLGIAVGQAAFYEPPGGTLTELSMFLGVVARHPDEDDRADSVLLFDGAQFNAAALYHAIKPDGSESSVADDFEGLKCGLRPFQVRALRSVSRCGGKRTFPCCLCDARQQEDC
jgi:hypothetical protein